MIDLRNVKEIGKVGPDWARGCKECKYGIVLAPEITGACELYLERLVQALDKQITFCECQAGTRYRDYLLSRRQFLLAEARNDYRMSAFAAKSTHPDIESARYAILESYGAAKAPSIRYVESEAQPVEAVAA